MPGKPTEARVLDPAKALDRKERAATRFRLQRAVEYGLPLWVAFGAADWMVVHFDDAGRLWVFWSLRLVGAALLALAWVFLRRVSTPTWRQLWAYDVLAFGGAALMLSLMCLEYEGLDSHYAGGVPLVLLPHTLASPDHWRRNLLVMAPPAAAHALTIAVATQVMPSIGAQLHDPGALTVWLLYEGYILTSYVLLVAGGHELWRLRRVVDRSHSIGRYDLVERIGQGGMGEVWRARDRTLKRDVAVKFVRGAWQADGVALARFEREARATCELEHPNTVRVFDFGTADDGLMFYAMELLDGEHIGQLVRSEGALAPKRALHLIGQAARALGEAHRQGMVHRDVKPGNLLVTHLGGERDFVKVLDFGIVHVAGAEALTVVGQPVGTHGYMAPEVLRGGEASPASDVYGLGAVLYLLLAGRPAFSGSLEAILAQQLENTTVWQALRTGRPLPPQLAPVVERCLAREPGARYPDAAALADALDAVRFD